jgi:very-short-patch-repair endonuclease
MCRENDFPSLVKRDHPEGKREIYTTKARFMKNLTPYNLHLKHNSRELCKNMTDAEIFLWSQIRMKQLNNCQFYRQKVIGDYIVDFFYPKYKLVIEVDGGQHYSDDMLNVDRKRDENLKSMGMKVLRFTNLDVLKNIDGVVARIIENIE